MSAEVPYRLAMLVDLQGSRERAGGRCGDVAWMTSAIARGEEEAFNVFYAEYSSRVYRLLLVVTQGEERLSRELHQAVMIKAARKLKRLETEGQLWAWLSAVARNEWRDDLRRRKRAEKFTGSSEGLVVGSVEVKEEELSSKLEAVLPKLTEEERALVESFYLEDRPQAELARRTGRTVKAIQCALARVRAKLRKLMEAE